MPRHDDLQTVRTTNDDVRAKLRQGGWIIDYRGWHEGDPLLPSKVFAQRGDERVRLLVDRWDVDN